MMSVRKLARAAHEGQALLVLVAPGASPTNMRRALGLPWPNTMFLRPPASLQRRQSPMRSRISGSEQAPGAKEFAAGAAPEEAARAPLVALAAGAEASAFAFTTGTPIAAKPA